MNCHVTTKCLMTITHSLECYSGCYLATLSYKDIRFIIIVTGLGLYLVYVHDHTDIQRKRYRNEKKIYTMYSISFTAVVG